MKSAIYVVVLCLAALAQGAVLVKDIEESIVHDDPSQAAAICAAPDSDGLLVAHEHCNKFYKCSFSKPVAMNCPSGLLYEPSLEICEWPQAVKCGNRIIYDGDDEDDKKPVTEAGSVNDDPSQAAAVCAAEGSDNDYVAHQYCNKFYQCWAGKPIALPCPVGTLWSPKKRYCDFSNNVDCGNRIIPDESEEADDSDKDSSSSDEDGPFGNNHDDPSKAPKICGTPDSSGVLVAHENCNQFYICTFGLPVSLWCPSGLLFDPSKDRCEWANTVNCGDRVIAEKDDEEKVTESGGSVNDDPSQAAAVCAAEGSDNDYVAHQHCNKFYQCWAGKPIALPCPVGTLWSPKKRYCDFSNNVDCGNRIIPDESEEADDPDKVSSSSEEDGPFGNNHDDPSKAPKICGTPDSSGVLVAHENCNQFYICTFGLPVSQWCPSGLLFDPSKDRCEWANTVNCGDRVIAEKDDEEKVTESGGIGNDDPSQAAVLCAAEGSDNSYVAHEKCDMFYQCWAGKPVPLPCPVGTLWNPKKSYCDFPYNVDCGDRILPSF